MQKSKYTAAKKKKKKNTEQLPQRSEVRPHLNTNLMHPTVSFPFMYSQW